ncbi:Co2+/Mg2+ efflux protein ApaG [Tenacibaculum sp. UWU-22]|uniref:Co2+/Mg2+ efflux protein ApaG n=1 Tax=Tenacibaculum sp. UWU-22 TaxID=3234187 RepID=UPI0034DB5EC1
MFEQITKGIKISVKTTYNGTMFRGEQLCYSFSYFISIENKSKNTVQLLERYWTVFDALNDVEFVDGEGVVGQKPILKPNDEYHYKSNCFLISQIGAMRGNYKMINLDNQKEFLVTIPTFQFSTNASEN